MIHRPSNARRNPLPYLALVLVLVLGVGGGYAIAASKTKTITVCADKKTGILHLKSHGKCKRSQTRVSWNQRGPQGPQGTQGSAGPSGAPAVTVWAQVANDGSVSFGQGLSVQHVDTGIYQVTITASTCATTANAPVISISDAPPTNLGTTFPVAWFGGTGINEQFMVFTGRVTGGSFTRSDHTFTVMDSCT